jgi:hypothetical protein
MYIGVHLKLMSTQKSKMKIEIWKSKMKIEIWKSKMKIIKSEIRGLVEASYGPGPEMQVQITCADSTEKLFKH